ncbi:OTU domain-containing protein DDB_G0284757 [Cajanus cajan]|uniref:ubiquitinyl hydrolase 1 n=1 Tax=Cajanus cajan TaxID=3821 RepID=A0A151TV61_CAJCA|nr:OTU domain-containing protein DDB_G0284757 [Cajanus cajan]XP_020213215.1 OTU domain-containing protein DDB_G0284757 [Cajanus cajan]XP_020213216.1 OTU domain-containing protein DDB_G0284757 [Cajanus cajan]KYP70891.1 OTU domain-containing protein DDB-G0284757 [Cajanus cajan]
MVLYEHSDVFQWGLNLLEGDPAYNPGYYGNIIQHDTGDIYNGDYFHNHYDNECNQIENDEIIARTLQEEFSQLDIAEPTGYLQAGEEQFHVSETEHTYDNGWQNSSMMHYCSGGHDYVQEGTGDEEPSSSCSSPGETEEYSLEITDNYPLDDEVGRKLSQMIPIPHVPKINGEIPSIDEATSDHQRLLDRLQLYDFVEHRVQGDGNCQFRALSDQLYNAPDQHKFVRRQVVNQLKSNPEIYDAYVPMEYDDYLNKMSKSGEWGDHVTLQAAADSYGVRIFVMTSFKDTCCIEILPHFEKPKGVIFLSFWAEVHYNSIYPQGDIASSESRKKKRWWSFGSKH